MTAGDIRSQGQRVARRVKPSRRVIVSFVKQFALSGQMFIVNLTADLDKYSLTTHLF